MTELDILLVYPPLSVDERYGQRDVGDVGGHLPPLGILSLAAVLRNEGYSVDVIDSLINGWGLEEVNKYIGEKKPKVIGLSAITPIFHRAVECADSIKKKFPDTLILLGGHHVTIMSEEDRKRYKCFDIGVVGEGEVTIIELMKSLKQEKYDQKAFLHNYKKLKNIDGIYFHKDGEIEVTKTRALIKDLDSLPFPARDFVPIEKYIPLPNQYKRKPVVHMVVIRGCPYNCSFCSNNAIFGRKIRARSPKKVVDEISTLKKRYGAREISFWDDMMTTNKDWMNEFCDDLIGRNVDITWTCYARADSVTKPLLQKMREAGCWNIFFGFESGDQQLLDNINKGITLADIRNANRWCKEVGIEVRASFMIALPGETPELGQKTIDFAKELNPEYAQFCITTPYPGTKLFDDAEKWGSKSIDYSKYNCWEPVFIPHGYQNKEQIAKLEKKANRDFYFRPKTIINLLLHLRSWEDVKRYFKGFRFLLGFMKK
ncbi:MAG: radical SAM protein [Candidatus Altiarchaeota archaeon]